MPDCELQDTCPFFINYKQGDYTLAISELIERVIEEYCRGNYTWCGRYLTFKALERRLEKQATSNLPRKYVDRIKKAEVKT